MSDPSNHLHDLNTLPTLKPARDVSKDLHRAARTYAEAEKQLSPAPEPEPAPAPPAASLPPAPAQPTQVPSQPSGPALVSQRTEEPPVQPGDTERVQKRINRLFGQMKSAQEANDAYATRVSQLEDQIAQLQAQRQQPSYNPDYQNYQPGPAEQAQSQPDGQFVSRAELNRMFGQMTQAFQQANQLAAAQRASRVEAESEFAQEFADPGFRQHTEAALARMFAQDPDGPYKAAVFTRGLLADARTQAPAQTAADAARKQSMSSFPSVPEGNGQSDDQIALYQQALAHAQRTGNHADYAVALQILQGQPIQR